MILKTLPVFAWLLWSCAAAPVSDDSLINNGHLPSLNPIFGYGLLFLVVFVTAMMFGCAKGCCQIFKRRQTDHENTPTTFNNPIADSRNSGPSSISPIDVRALELDPIVIEPLPSLNQLTPVSTPFYNKSKSPGFDSTGRNLQRDMRLHRYADLTPTPSGIVPPVDVTNIFAHDWFDESFRNFPRNRIEFQNEVGEGWFGKVIEGEAEDIVPFAKKLKVIVKVLREDAAGSEQMRFLDEVRVFRDANHGNILKLLGHAIETTPFLLMLEHCPKGDLKAHLINSVSRAESMNAQMTHIKMALDIAKGLEWMDQADFVHQDLAARNCQVGSEDRIIIGDYGLATAKYRDDYYWDRNIAIPLRWSAPETLRCTINTIHTLKVFKSSNVWTFGIVLWEICEFGKLPYNELSDQEVADNVVTDRSITLQSPSRPGLRKKDELYEVMKLCWNSKPEMRPTMGDIVRKLDTLLADSVLPNPPLQSSVDEEDFDRKWDMSSPQSSSSPAQFNDNSKALSSLSKRKSVSFRDTSPFAANASLINCFKGDVADRSTADLFAPVSKVDSEEEFVSSDFGVIAQKVKDSSRSATSYLVLTHVEPADLNDNLNVRVNQNPISQDHVTISSEPLVSEKTYRNPCDSASAVTSALINKVSTSNLPCSGPESPLLDVNLVNGGDHYIDRNTLGNDNYLFSSEYSGSTDMSLTALVTKDNLHELHKKSGLEDLLSKESDEWETFSVAVCSEGETSDSKNQTSMPAIESSDTGVISSISEPTTNLMSNSLSNSGGKGARNLSDELDATVWTTDSVCNREALAPRLRLTSTPNLSPDTAYPNGNYSSGSGSDNVDFTIGMSQPVSPISNTEPWEKHSQPTVLLGPSEELGLKPFQKLTSELPASNCDDEILVTSDWPTFAKDTENTEAGSKSGFSDIFQGVENGPTPRQDTPYVQLMSPGTAASIQEIEKVKKRLNFTVDKEPRPEDSESVTTSVEYDWTTVIKLPTPAKPEENGPQTNTPVNFQLYSETNTEKDSFTEDIIAATEELGSLVMTDLEEDNNSVSVIKDTTYFQEEQSTYLPDVQEPKLAFQQASKPQSAKQDDDPRPEEEGSPFRSRNSSPSKDPVEVLTNQIGNSSSSCESDLEETGKGDTQLYIPFVPSKWNQNLTPGKPSIKSPEQTRFKEDGDFRKSSELEVNNSLKKSVSFEKKGPQLVYHYPRPPPTSDSDDEGRSPQLTSGQRTTNFLDWELQPDELDNIPVQDDPDDEICPKSSSNPMDMYRISDFDSLSASDSNAGSSHFYSNSETSGLSASFSTESPSEVCNATSKVGSEVRMTLGELRHTRAKLKLDLTRSDTSPTENDPRGLARKSFNSKSLALDSGVGSASTNATPSIDCDH